MRISIYRFIDKVIGGVLIHFLYFIFILPKNLAKDKSKKFHPRKILVIKLWAIGDSIVALPLIKILKKRFPDSQIDVLTRDRTIAVFKGNTDLNKIISLDSIISTISILRKYDLAIDLEPYLNLSALISFYSASQRHGFSNQLRSKLYTVTVNFRHDQHMLQNYIDFSKLLNCEITEEDKNLVKIKYTFYDESTISNFLKSNGIESSKDLIIGICAGSGESAKTRLWSKDNFVKLANELIEKYNAKIILVGGKTEEEISENITELIENKESIINAVNKFTLKESCALIEKCKIFISNDTGPMHIAAAHGVKTIGLFGPNTPVLWKPYGDSNFAIYKNVECSPCIINDKGVFPDCLRKEDKYLCMRLISVDDVLRAVQNVLSKKE